jgi:hypothetical protein
MSEGASEALVDVVRWPRASCLRSSRPHPNGQPRAASGNRGAHRRGTLAFARIGAVLRFGAFSHFSSVP